MFTQLVMEDSLTNTMKGTGRAAIASAVLFSTGMLWYGLIARKFYDQRLKQPLKFSARTVLPFVLAIGLLSAALSVQAPKNIKEVFTYGKYVGLVCHGFFNLMMFAVNPRWDFCVAIVDTLYGTIAAMLAAWIIYLVKPLRTEV